MSAEIAIEQPSEADIDAIHAMLKDTYWSPGIPRDVVARADALIRRVILNWKPVCVVTSARTTQRRCGL